MRYMSRIACAHMRGRKCKCMRLLPQMFTEYVPLDVYGQVEHALDVNKPPVM